MDIDLTLNAAVYILFEVILMASVETFLAMSEVPDGTQDHTSHGPKAAWGARTCYTVACYF